MRNAHTIFLDLADSLAEKCGMKRLIDIAGVFSGVARPKAASRTANYVQIKDLKEAGAQLLRAAAPSVKRATPIEASDILVPSNTCALTRPAEAYRRHRCLGSPQ